MDGKGVEFQGMQSIIKSLSVDRTLQQLLSGAAPKWSLLYTSEKAAAYLNYLVSTPRVKAFKLYNIPQEVHQSALPGYGWLDPIGKLHSVLAFLLTQSFNIKKKKWQPFGSTEFKQAQVDTWIHWLKWAWGLTSRLMGGRYHTLHTIAQLLIIRNR